MRQAAGIVCGDGYRGPRGSPAADPTAGGRAVSAVIADRVRMGVSGSRDERPRRVRRGRVALWLLAPAVLIALLAVGLAGKGATAGRRAPALPAQALVGRPVTLAALLGAGGSAGSAASSGGGEHAALVLFWASWCTPCQQEAPAVERFARSAAGRGRIVGVDYGENERGPPRAFLRRYGWSFPNLRDPDARAGGAYDLANLPSTFVIDAHGRIRETLRGPQTEASLTRALRAVES